jgi:hypothetical protein
LAAGRRCEAAADRLERVGPGSLRIEGDEQSRRSASANGPDGPRQGGQRPLQLVDDRQVGRLTGSRERVQVDRNDPLAEPLQRLRPVPIFERYEDDVGMTDPPRVDPSPVGRKSRDPTGGADT